MSGRYGVVIPAFNAAKTIGEVVRLAKAAGWPVIVVDDGSTDNTAAVSAGQGALVISHLRNQGKGCALRTGFAHALRSHWDGVVTLDSDGQHDPAEIPQLIAEGERQHASLVLGNRVVNGARMPAARRWANAAMSRLISTRIRQPIPDSQCGFRFIHKELLDTLPLRAKRFEAETELVIWTAVRRWKIISVPVRSIYRNHESHIRPVRDGVRFLWVLLRSLGWR